MVKIKYCIQCGKPLAEKQIEGKLRKYCPACGYIHYLNPIPIVAIVVNKDDKILIVKRGIEPEKGKWVLPGGFVDSDESPEDAAKRELREETNLIAEDMRLIKMVNANSVLHGPILMMGFEALGVSGKPVAGDDAVSLKFKKITNLKEIAFKSHRIIIREYLGR